VEPSVSRTVITIAALFVIFAGLKLAEPIVNPFLLAILFATLLAPPFMWLQRKKIPTVLALLIIVAGFFLIQTLLVAFVGSQMTAFRSNLPMYQDHLNSLFGTVPAHLKKFGIEMEEDWTSYFDPNAAAALAGTLFSGLSGMLANTFLILLTVIFILLEASSFPVKMRAIALNPHASLLKFEKILSDIQSYMAIKTWMSILTGVAVAIALALLDVGYPLLWGLLAFLLNYIPNIGSIIASVPPVLLALIEQGPGMLMLVGTVLTAINVLIGNVIEPRFMSRGLGLSTLVVFVSLIFWGWILGPIGMLLSIPLTMTLKIMVENNEETRWISILLGPEKVVDQYRSSRYDEA